MSVTDPDLHDPELLEEIELLGELVIAASDSEGQLPAARLDGILGVRRRDASASSLTGSAGSPESASGP